MTLFKPAGLSRILVFSEVIYKRKKNLLCCFFFVNMFLLCYIRLNPLRLGICGLVRWLFTFEVTELWLGDNLSLRWTDVAETVLDQCVMKNCWQLVAGIFELTKSKMVEAPAEICSSRLMEFRNLHWNWNTFRIHWRSFEGKTYCRRIRERLSINLHCFCLQSYLLPLERKPPHPADRLPSCPVCSLGFKGAAVFIMLQVELQFWLSLLQ